jgi:hypothetical protein
VRIDTPGVIPATVVRAADVQDDGLRSVFEAARGRLSRLRLV